MEAPKYSQNRRIDVIITERCDYHREKSKALGTADHKVKKELWRRALGFCNDMTMKKRRTIRLKAQHVGHLGQKTRTTDHIIPAGLRCFLVYL